MMAERAGRRAGGRPTREAAAARDDRVMGVATALFVERGFAETTLEEIARRAGVAKRTLYAHYHDKGQLFAAVVRARASVALGRRLDAGAAGDDLHAALLALARDVVGLLTSAETVEMNRLLIAEAQRFPDLVREITAIGLLDLHAAVARAFERLAAQGAMRLEGASLPVAVRFCDAMGGLSALHAAMGVGWTTPDEAELKVRVALFAAAHAPARAGGANAQ